MEAKAPRLQVFVAGLDVLKRAQHVTQKLEAFTSTLESSEPGLEVIATDSRLNTEKTV